MVETDPLLATLFAAPGMRAGAYELALDGRRFLVAVAEIDFQFAGLGDALEPVMLNGGDVHLRDRGGDAVPPYLPEAEIGIDGPKAKTPLRLRMGRGSSALIDKVGRLKDFAMSAPLWGSFPAICKGGQLPLTRLPAQTPFSEFQRAPKDQRVAWLAGCEWFELDGDFGKLRGHLPNVTMRCLIETAGFVGEPLPMEPILALDRVMISPERRLLTVSGRCHVELRDRGTLEEAHLRFALALRGAEIEWPEFGLPSKRASLASPAVTIPPKRVAETLVLEGNSDTERAPLSSDSSDLERTLKADLRLGRVPKLNRAHPLPFAGTAERRTDSQAPWARPPGGPLGTDPLPPPGRPG